MNETRLKKLRGQPDTHMVDQFIQLGSRSFRILEVCMPTGYHADQVWLLEEVTVPKSFKPFVISEGARHEIWYELGSKHTAWVTYQDACHALFDRDPEAKRAEDRRTSEYLDRYVNDISGTEQCRLFTTPGAYGKSQILRGLADKYGAPYVNNISDKKLPKYDHREIAWLCMRLQATAQGEMYDGNALYVAKDIKCLNADDVSILEAWLTGREGVDPTHYRMRLQDIANKIADTFIANDINADITAPEKIGEDAMDVSTDPTLRILTRLADTFDEGSEEWEALRNACECWEMLINDPEVQVVSNLLDALLIAGENDHE